MGRPAINHEGETYGMLTVIRRVYDAEKSGSGQNACWLCRCRCGRMTVLRSSELRRTKSCGCLLRSSKITHGETGTRLYNVWNTMKQRCKNERSPGFKYYGARGVKICEEWAENYNSFAEWARSHGWDDNAPRGRCTVDRIDPAGDYRPENCRITTMAEQAKNRKNSIFVEHKGEKKTLAEWSRELGISYKTLQWRYSEGQRGERLLRPNERRRTR